MATTTATNTQAREVGKQRHQARTLIQAQDRYIDRARSCHPGHANRVQRAAHRELFQWAQARGYDGKVVCRDARDMLELELACDD